MTSHDDHAALLDQIRQQLVALHDTLSMTTELLATRVNALATRADETNVRVDELHAKLDAVMRETRDYMTLLDRNAARASTRRRLRADDFVLEPLDLSPIEWPVRNSDEPDGHAPDRTNGAMISGCWP